MFQGFQQRLQKNLNLDFLDNKIAEEQAKQQQPARGSSPAKRTTSNAGTRRGTGRGDVRLGGRPRPEDARDVNLGPASKGPDPEDFMIGEDVANVSRTATPNPTREGVDGPTEEGEKVEEKEGNVVKGKEKGAPDTLPQEVRQKLAKLETLTTRYQDLLRNYRTAHAHVATILPFEATLREHTPLTSISDPGALVEFLNQRTLQSDMVMQELKRVTGEQQQAVQERDVLKLKIDESQKQAKEASDEAARLRREHEDAAASLVKLKDNDAFFSYEDEVSRVGTDDSEHASQVEQLIQQVEGQIDRASELSTANTTSRTDLETTLSELGRTQSELSAALSNLDKATVTQDEMRVQLAESQAKNAELQEQIRDAETKLARQGLRSEDSNRDAPPSAQSKRMETMESLISTLRGQISNTEESKKNLDSENADLRHQIAKLEDEAISSSKVISGLRDYETRAGALVEQVSLLSKERDAAKNVAISKTGHEAKVASLRSQLSQVEKDRDLAYRIIIACRRNDPEWQETAPQCGNLPQSKSNSDLRETQNTATDTGAAPPTQDVVPIEGDGLLAPVDANKKGKKKQKSKAKAQQKPPKPTAEASTVASTADDSPDLIPSLPRYQELLQAHEAHRSVAPLFKTILEEFQASSQSRNDEIARLSQIADDLAERSARTTKDYEDMIRVKNSTIASLEASSTNPDTLVALQSEVNSLEERLSARADSYNKEIKSLHERLDGLEEERETLQDSLLDVGNRATDSAHQLKQVSEAKVELQKDLDKALDDCTGYKEMLDIADDRIAELSSRIKCLEEQSTSDEEIKGIRDQLERTQRESESLQSAKEACERQIEALEVQQKASGAESGSRYNALSAELAAAKQLSQSRYRDLTDLREHYNRIQPELKRLRDESAELKPVKAELERVGASVKRLEAKERDLRSEIAEYKSQSGAKDAELLALKEKAEKSEEEKAVMEEACGRARKDLEKSESTRNEVIEAREKAQGDAKRLDHELRTSRPRLAELEKQVKKLSDETSSLRDEVQMKTAQQQSAQSSMDNMREQTRELVTQMKESRQRNENLEEELQDAQRLLSERSREGDTMRRLMKDSEERAEQRVKEMRTELERANEERDRAEDEISSIGRKKAREMEEIKSKLRDAEEQARHANSTRQEVERREHEFCSRYEEVGRQARQAQEDQAEVRSVITQLHETLDKGERQSRELEKEKTEMRRTLEEREAQLERLRKSSRTMAEELQKLQAVNKAGSLQSSHPPIEPGRVTYSSVSDSSPAKKGERVDYVYLKNVLLNFLEQKERRNQMQLVPVLGMLLHLDQQEQQKWMAAISAK